MSLRTGPHVFRAELTTNPSRPQWDTCGGRVFSDPWGHPLLSTLELGILGKGPLGLAETLPMLLDLGGKVQIFTVMGFTDHSPIEIPPQNPSRRTRVSWWVYLGHGGIKQLAGFIACG